jgi:hypothetical protein
VTKTKVKTWTDKEIIDLMLREIKDYKLDQIRRFEEINYEHMMECVLWSLKDKGLIEDTP